MESTYLRLPNHCNRCEDEAINSSDMCSSDLYVK